MGFMDMPRGAYKKIVNPDNGFSLYIFDDGDEFMNAMAGMQAFPKAGGPDPFQALAKQRDLDDKLRAVSRRLKDIHKKSFVQESRVSALVSENNALKRQLAKHQNQDILVSAQFLMGLIFLTVVSMIALFLF